MSARAENFDPAQFPRRLNLGCGNDRRPGYLNVDIHEWQNPDLVADICHLDMLPAGYYEEIVAQDVLEHLPRLDTKRVLAHWNGLLAMGGKLFLRVPDPIGLANLLKRPDSQSVAKQEELIQCLFGTQSYSGDFHLTAFTRPILEHYLAVTGFAVVEIKAHDGWLYDVVARKNAQAVASADDEFGDLVTLARDEDFVRESYRRILQREPDEAGCAYFVKMLASGSLLRSGVIQALAGSPERARLAAPKG